MLTQDRINSFRTRAKAAGYSDDQIAEEIARKNLEESGSVPTASPPVNKQGFMQKAVKGVADFLLPRTTKLAEDLSVTGFGGQRTDQAWQSASGEYDRSKQLIQQAMRETDPVKKQRLLEASRQTDTAAGQNLEDTVGGFLKEGKNVSQASYGAQALGVGGEIGSMLYTPGNVFNNAKLAGKIGNAAVRGAVSGGIYGATAPEDLSAGERLGKTVKGAGVGALTSAALSAAWNVPIAVAKKILPTAQQSTARLFRVAPSQMAEFRKSTGGMDFTDEIVKRDLKNIAGMDYTQMLGYFDDKNTAAYKAVEDYLSGKTETLPKRMIQEHIATTIEKLSPEKGNVGQEGAVSALLSIMDDLDKAPDDLTLVQANTIKRQLQDLGKAAFSPNGSPTPASGAYAGASNFVKRLIETVAPDVKPLNRDIQFYRLAKDSIEKTGDQYANKVSNDILQKFVQTIPFTAGVGAGVITGNPAMVAAGVALSGAGGALRNKYLSPEVQTKLASSLTNAQVPNAESIVNAVIDQVGRRAGYEVTKPGSGTVPAAQAAEPPQNGQVLGNTTTEQPQQPETLSPGGQWKWDKTANDWVPNVPGDQAAEQDLSNPNKLIDILTKAAVMDLANGGKNISEITAVVNLLKNSGNAKISANQQAALAKLNTGEILLNEIEKSYATISPGESGALARVTGRYNKFMGNLGYNASVKSYEDIRKGTMSLIARALGEVGTLNEGDIQRAMLLVPGADSTQEEAQLNLAKLRTILKAAKGAITNLPAAEPGLVLPDGMQFAQ